MTDPAKMTSEEKSHLNASYPKDSHDPKLLKKRIEQLEVAAFQVRLASGKGHLGNIYGLFVIEILQAEIDTIRTRLKQKETTN